MISFLRSKFSLSEKRALCVTADTVTVYHWEDGGITDAFVFDADESGQAIFSRYLAETPLTPVYILVDIVEEEYRFETVPHVLGSDRRALIERKFTRHFRGTPYCHAITQGRETEGRRDDILLLTALMNPDVVAPWVRCCAERKVPVAGIYSLPILSKSLLHTIGAKSTHVLLVTMQNASGLRQTYFRDQEIKISRLARMPRLGTVPFAPHILGELDRLQRYLNSQRLLTKPPLDIFILSHGDLLEDLTRQCRNTDAVRYHLLDVAGIAVRMGIQGALTTPFSDYLFAHQLLALKPKNHYAREEERSYFKLHRTRIGMIAASFLILLGSTFWSGFNVINAISLKWQGLEAEQKANFYQSRFDVAKKGLPPTPVEPFDIKTAIDIVDTLAKHKAQPMEAMTRVSQVLNRFANLQLEEIQWTATANPDAPPGEGKPGGEASAPEPSPNPGGSFSYYHVAVIKGYISPFAGDYREALATVNRFADSLRALDSVYDVKVITMPLDISSEASLRGDAAEAAKPDEANFSVRVVLGVKHEAA
jgi:hypothetical protein